MIQKILVVEDEKDIIRLLEFNLKKEGYEVHGIGRGDEALDAARKLKPNLVILDLMIPGLDGFEVCKLLRANSETKHIPIIMLTAKNEDIHVVAGLELGADDYVTKPFSIAVLIARVRSLLRRKSSVPATSKALSFRGLLIHPDQFSVEVEGRGVRLTLSEFRILECLANTPSRVWSRNQIIDAVRGENHIVTDRVVDVLMANLRKKLGSAGEFIQTVRGVGYRFVEPGQ
jgi:two-component system phosphate regulon response regulator PhoB